MIFSERYFDRSGAEVTEAEWSVIDKDVARDDILLGVFVSTRFLGYELSSSTAKTVVMFETMALVEQDGEYGPECEELGQVRSATETEARIAHIEMVDRIRKELGK